MTIAAVLANFQEINRAITGVKLAPDEYPASINTADLPMALTRVGEGTWYQQAVGLPRADTTFIIDVFVLPSAQGQGVDQGFQSAVTLMDAFRAKYNQADQGALIADLEVDQVAAIRCSGHKFLILAGTQYTGFDVEVDVVEK